MTRNREVHAGLPAHGAGPALAARARAVVAAGATELGPEYTRGVVASTRSRRDVLFEGLTGDPRRLPAQARGRVLLHRPPAGRGQRGLRALAAGRLPARRRDRDGGARPRLLRHARPGRDEVRIAYVLKEEDLGRRSRSSPPALAAYRKARGLSDDAASRPPGRSSTSTCPRRAEGRRSRRRDGTDPGVQFHLAGRSPACPPRSGDDTTCRKQASRSASRPRPRSFLGEIEKKGIDEKRSAETLASSARRDAGSVLRELSEAYRRQSSLLEIAEAIGSQLGLVPLIERVLAETTGLLDADRASLYLVDRQTPGAVDEGRPGHGRAGDPRAHGPRHRRPRGHHRRRP